MDSNNSLLWSDSWMIGADKIDAQRKELSTGSMHY